MTDSALICSTSQRREKLKARNANDVNVPPLNGIDFVEFESRQKVQVLRVYFLCTLPSDIDDKFKDYEQFDIYSPMVRGRVKVTNVQVVPGCQNAIYLTTEPHLCPGAAYTLTLRKRHDIDPRFGRFEFTAHSDILEIDPKQRTVAPRCGREDPKINYLARDYTSFRQMLFDRASQIIPEWTERRVPDLGVTLIELFAYVGDYLAYHQDAVATEAYLNTARQRISVKRHARLVDYQLHEGCNARTFVHVTTAGTDTVLLNPDQVYFITEHPDPRKRFQAVLDPSELENLPPNSYQPFEIIRWEPRCGKLECNDIKNIVGLMATLVEYGKLNHHSYESLSRTIASFIWGNLPAELKDRISDYVATAVAKPDALMVEDLLAALNRMLEQYCLMTQVKGGTRNPRYDSLQHVFDASVSDNVNFLKGVFSDFFSRMDDSQIELHPAHNEMLFYTWDQSECHLPVGTTRAVLCDDPDCRPFDVAQKPLMPVAVPYDSDAVELPNGEIARPGVEKDESKGEKRFRPSPYVLAHLDIITSDPPRPTDSARGWNLRQLSVGDILIFEETLGPRTHNSSDADINHRQAVRLTRVNFSIDPVSRMRIVEIEWDHEDALTFPLCISSVITVNGQCQLRRDISVARGNVLLVDHGRTLDPEWIGEPLDAVKVERCGDSYLDEVPPPIPSRGELFRPTLKEPNLTFAVPTQSCASATALLKQEQHEAIPALRVQAFPIAEEPVDSFRDDDVAPPTLVTFDDLVEPERLLQRVASYTDLEVRRINGILPATAARFLQDIRSAKLSPASVRGLLAGPGLDKSGGVPAAVPAAKLNSNAVREAAELVAALRASVTWNPKLHLLDSDSESQDVVVEVDNDRRANLLFGDDDLGRRQMSDTSFYATYRVGNGVIGNVGAGKIKHLVYRVTRQTGIAAIINPLPARGGVEPESLEHARVHAPATYKKQRRAIIASDYAEIARQEFAGEIQQARAALNWMGTWYEVSVAIDPMSTVRDPQDLVARVSQTLESYRRIGHLLKVKLPTYVGLDLCMTVCVETSYLSAHIRQELLDRFSAGVLDDGTLGFFHPDNFGFGDELYLSRIVAEAKKVQGVENVNVTKFQKRGLGDQGELENGVMTFGSLEIPRLDNDPLRPEAGSFCLRMEGTR